MAGTYVSDRRRRTLLRVPAIVGLAVVTIAALLTGIAASPAAADPGDSVSIHGPYCSYGAGEVLFQITNAGNTETDLNLNVGPYTREATVPANTTWSVPINNIPDGTYQAKAIFFITPVAERTITIDCVPDIETIPLGAPSVSVSRSGSTLNASWTAPGGARTYDYRVTASGNRFAAANGRTSRSISIDLGTRSGEICVYVKAKAPGRISSYEGSRCIDVPAPPAPLARPTVQVNPSGQTLQATWNRPAGASRFNYRITRDGTEIPGTRQTNVNRIRFYLPTNNTTGNYCVYVTATAPGRTNSPQGSACRYFTAPSPIAAPTVTITQDGSSLRGSWNSPTGATRFNYRVTRNDAEIPGTKKTGTNAQYVDVPTSGGNGIYCVYVIATGVGRPQSAEARKCAIYFAPVPLPKPSLRATVSDGTMTVTWLTPSGAKSYAYRTTLDGTGSSPSSNLFYGNKMTVRNKIGRVCVYVKAKAPDRPDSPESEICKTVTDALAAPAVSMSLGTAPSGSSLHASWTRPPGGTAFNYRITRNGTAVPGGARNGTTARSLKIALDPGTAGYCVFVTATAPGRTNSPEGRVCNNLTVLPPLATPSPSIRIVGDYFRPYWPRVHGAATYDWTMTAEGVEIGSKQAGACCGSVVLIEDSAGQICVDVKSNAIGRTQSAVGRTCITHKQALDTPTVSVESETASLQELAVFQWQANSKAKNFSVRITRNDQLLTTRTAYRNYYNYRVTSGGVYCAYVTANPKASYHLKSKESESPGCVTVNSQPLAKPPVFLSIWDGKLQIRWNGIYGAESYEWKVTRGDTLVADDPQAGCCYDEIPLGPDAEYLCVTVVAKAEDRTSSDAGLACKQTLAALPTPVLNTTVTEVELGTSVKFTWDGRSDVSGYQFRVEHETRSPITYPVGGDGTSFSYSLRWPGRYCMTLSSAPRLPDLQRKSAPSEPLCVSVLPPPSNEAAAFASQYGGTLWGNDARSAQTILNGDPALAAGVRAGNGYGQALYAASIAAGTRGPALAEAMGMTGRPTATEVETIVASIIPRASRIDIDSLRSMSQTMLARDDLFQLLITDQQEQVFEQAAANFGTESMQAFTAKAAASLKAADVSYASYLGLLIPLGYMTGHQHFEDLGVTGPEILNGVGLVFGSGSTAYTFTSANAAKTMGGLGFAVGGYSLLADVANGTFDGDVADGASILALFASGAALVAGPVGGVIFGIISVIASLASFFLSTPPTLDSPVSKVFAYQREYAAAKAKRDAEEAREDAERAAAKASLEVTKSKLQDRMMAALRVYWRGGNGLGGHADESERIVISVQGQSQGRGKRYIFKERDDRSGREYTATIEDQGFSTGGIYISLGIDLQNDLGLVNVRDCPFGIWDNSRKVECIG